MNKLFIVICVQLALVAAVWRPTAAVNALDSNPYFKYYSKLNYDTQDLHEKHLRARRSADDQIVLSFKGYGKQFEVKLRPKADNSFDHDYIEVHDGGSVKLIPTSDLVLYEGEVLGKPPGASHVLGTIIDGVFSGTIDLKNEGKYYVETATRYIPEDQIAEFGGHSIMYHEDDVNTHEEVKKSKFKGQDAEKVMLSNGGGCGSAKKHVHEEMLEIQREFASNATLKRTLFDHNEPFYYKYTKEANMKPNTNSRSKRQTVNQRFFPNSNTQNTCGMYLKVDPYLYNQIFYHEGKQSATITANYLMYFLNQEITTLNSIFNPLQFYDSTKTNYYTGVSFRISRTKLYTFAECNASPSKLSTAEQSLCTNYLDETTFLNSVSLDDFSAYCLSFTFTARDFSDGTLGLAWIASASSGTIGGVCQKPVTSNGVSKSFNSGIVTIISYNSVVPSIVAQLTFTHEVGHSFGSPHDTDGTSCAPGDANGGNYIMYSHASSGLLANNRKFSSCSLSSMGLVVNALVGTSKFCFIQQTSAICGNGIVETGEQCDCGYSDQCNETCCYSADSGAYACRLKANAICSPSMGACCTTGCTYQPSSFICLANSDCMTDTYCTGASAVCPSTSSIFFKPDLTLCSGNSLVCLNGSCSGSICLKYGLTQCSLTGDLTNPATDLTSLCHLACNGTLTQYKCVDSFQIPLILSQNNNSGFYLKPGSACSNSQGYCDIFYKCRSYDANEVISRLANFLLSPDQTISDIKSWAIKYWWAILLISVTFLVLVGIFVFVCTRLLPSTNPRKQAKHPNVKFKEAIRHPTRLFKSPPSQTTPKTTPKTTPRRK